MPGYLDYILLPEADGILVEELVLAGDGTATGLDSAGWRAAGGGWWSSAAYARELRTDAGLRGRVVAVRRREAESVYRRLSGAELPDEATLRTFFHDRLPLAGSPPLVLTPPQPPDGFHEVRVYRVLFAGDLGQDSLPRLREVWRMALADPRERVVGTAESRVAGDWFTWDVRRIGPGTAWCLDLTARLGSESDTAVRPLLRELTVVMRAEGLIPVTIERFS
ncbi:hypothetical protein [Nonomuraea glycinis]|uniref:hypothetical protein n=1 Tax=Nonomuraea glycinis TaxID=2047744 RepID=UPI002E13A2BC|nr:hypothetical protein OHA68_15385 [Nonomuraea glycinis]